VLGRPVACSSAARRPRAMRRVRTFFKKSGKGKVLKVRRLRSAEQRLLLTC
jgi:hypothetical protein